MLQVYGGWVRKVTTEKGGTYDCALEMRTESTTYKNYLAFAAVPKEGVSVGWPQTLWKSKPLQLSFFKDDRPLLSDKVREFIEQYCGSVAVEVGREDYYENYDTGYLTSRSFFWDYWNAFLGLRDHDSSTNWELRGIKFHNDGIRFCYVDPDNSDDRLKGNYGCLAFRMFDPKISMALLETGAKLRMRVDWGNPNEYMDIHWVSCDDEGLIVDIAADGFCAQVSHTEKELIFKCDFIESYRNMMSEGMVGAETRFIYDIVKG